MIDARYNHCIMRDSGPRNASVQLIDCPPTLYRYTPHEYASELTSKGAVRVSPLVMYQNIADPQRRDSHEGTKALLVPDGITEKLKFGPFEFRQPALSRGNVITFEAPPSYCLCMSTQCARQLSVRFSDRRSREPASCVRVDKASEFLLALDAEFRAVACARGVSVAGSLAGAVCYKKGNMYVWQTNELPHDPRFIKPLDPHAPECEFRIVWTVSSQSGGLSPIYLTCGALTKHLTLLSAADIPLADSFTVPVIE